MNALHVLLPLLLSLASGADARPGDAPQLLGDATHGGRYETTGPKVAVGGSPKLKWTADLVDGITVQPLLVDGVLYVGTDKGDIHALDAATGKTRWKVRAAEKMIGGTPAWADGLILVGGHDRHLRAIDAKTGAPRWKILTDERILAAPVVAGGVVYFVSWDGRLRAATVATGEILWTYVLRERMTTREYRRGKVTNPVELSAAPAVVGGVVYVAARNEIHAVDASKGTKRWILEEDFGGADAPTVVVDGVVYQGTEHGVLAADAATGKKLWRWGGDNVMAAPAVRDGVVYVLDWGHELSAVDAKTSKWHWSVPLEPGQESSPVLLDGRLYVGSDCSVVALDPKDGARIWTFDPDAGGIRSTPVIQNGIYYGATWPGTVFAIE